MVTREWRSKIGFGGLLLTGILGIIYALVTQGVDWLWLIVIFGMVTAVGIAGFFESYRGTAWTFLLTGGVAALFAVGQTVIYGPTEPLAVLLVLLALITLYRGTQYRQAGEL